MNYLGNVGPNKGESVTPGFEIRRDENMPADHCDEANGMFASKTDLVSASDDESSDFPSEDEEDVSQACDNEMILTHGNNS